MKRKILRPILWAGTVVLLFVLILGSIALGLVVGDWLFSETHAQWLSWAVGLIVILAAVLCLGVSIGVYAYWRHKDRVEINVPKVVNVALEMENLLAEENKKASRD